VLAYAKVLDVGEDLVVESEVIAGNDIDASRPLNIPVLQTKSLGLAEKLSLRELSAPVCLGSFLQLTVCSHARETENGSVVEARLAC